MGRSLILLIRLCAGRGGKRLAWEGGQWKGQKDSDVEDLKGAPSTSESVVQRYSRISLGFELRLTKLYLEICEITSSPFWLEKKNLPSFIILSL